MTAFRRPRWFWGVLAAGIVAWAVFVGLDALRRLNDIHGTYPWVEYWRFDADADRGFAELTGYLVLLVAAGALLVAWRRGPGRAAYASLALILIAIVLDDSLELHERGGSALWPILGWQNASIRAQDMGELAIWAMIGIPLAVVFVITWRRSSARARRNALVIVAWLTVMLVFATGVDLLGPATGPDGLNWHRRVRYALRLFEYTGEFAAMVAICLASLRIAATPPQGPTADDSVEDWTRPRARPKTSQEQ